MVMVNREIGKDELFGRLTIRMCNKNQGLLK